ILLKLLIVNLLCHKVLKTTTMIIRPVQEVDIPLLAEFWYDQMALLSQKQSFIGLMPDAIEQWRNYAYEIMQEELRNYRAVEIEQVIVGCMIERIEDNQAGLLTQICGVIV